MLGLKLSTDPRWVNLTEKSLQEILTDHAYCEQKAASTCISLIQNNPEQTHLVEQLAPVVSEEWGHFRMVLNELKKRNLPLGKQRKDEYVNALQQFLIKQAPAPQKLADKLLMSALIEARSCERFKLLSENINDTELKSFYRNLMIAEANHYTLFLELSQQYLSKNEYRIRWQQWLNYEAQVMKTIELRGDRIH